MNMYSASSGLLHHRPYRDSGYAGGRVCNINPGHRQAGRVGAAGGWSCRKVPLICVRSSSSSNAVTEVVGRPREGISGEERGAAADGIETRRTGVLVVGAGLAGLAAARQLAASGTPFVVVEASDGVGGRVRTDRHEEGFLLDRGFQIFITAYPEARRVLDYGALQLRPFYAGALVRFAGAFHRVADPLRHPWDGLLSLPNPIGTPLDKLRVGLARFRAAARPDADLLAAPEQSILERVRRDGFSDAMVDRFFRPFFGGIFFDRGLGTTSRLFDFVFKCLALGSNTLPSRGIGAIPELLAGSLPPASLSLNSRVVDIAWSPDGRHPSGVRLQDGRSIAATQGILLAVEGPEAAKLLGSRLPTTASITKPSKSTVCLYFAAEGEAPTREPILFLNGTGKGLVNNMFFPTTVAPSYGPPGKTLVSVSLVGLHEDKTEAQLEAAVRAELAEWFGKGAVEAWRHLRSYRIPLAQPDQSPPTHLRKDCRLQEGLYVCGDHRDSATFDGALLSGRRAAEALLADIRATIPLKKP